MPRQARLDTPGTLHHVMMRGIGGRRIFHADEDREEFVSRLSSLYREQEIRMAEIARHVRGCTSAMPMLFEKQRWKIKSDRSELRPLPALALLKCY
jgi:hypothetical protein